MEKQFTTFQIATALNLKYGRLREWLDRGYIKPSIHKAQRQGEKTLFTLTDAYIIKLFDYLLGRGFSREDAGIRIKALQTGIEALQQMGNSTLTSATYVAFYRQEGSDVYFQLIDDEKVSLSLFGRTVEGKRGSFDDVLIVNFRKIREQIDQALT